MSRAVWIFLLAFLTSAAFIFPVISAGTKGTFYTIDPDISYLSNALSYIKTRQIHYIDHPGTPTIIIFALMMTPLRLYMKFIAHSPFILWSLNNLDLVFFITRVFQSLVMGVSLGIFLLGMLRFFRSKSVIIFAWLSLLGFSAFPFLSSSISPETLSFFIIAVWLNIFVSFLNTNSWFFLPAMSTISGIAIANKFSNLFLGLISICLPLAISRISIKSRLSSCLIQTLLVALGFIAGTWPIKGSYPQLLNWVKLLANSSEIHGGGIPVFFDLSTYLNSISSLYYRDPWLMALIVISVVALLLLHRINPQILILTVGSLLGAAVFAKYPLSHYQFAHYFLLIFAVCHFLIFLPRIAKVLLLVILILIAVKNVDYYYRYISTMIRQTQNLENYVANHPTKFPTLWEWGRSKDFALLWATSPAWHGKTFLSEKIITNSPYLEMSNLKNILLPEGKEVTVFSRCWDTLYIQESSAALFVSAHPNRGLAFTTIPLTDHMAVIHSNHCSRFP